MLWENVQNFTLQSFMSQNLIPLRWIWQIVHNKITSVDKKQDIQISKVCDEKISFIYSPVPNCSEGVIFRFSIFYHKYQFIMTPAFFHTLLEQKHA